MDEIERVFKTEVLKDINIYQYNTFKKDMVNIYNAFIKAIRTMKRKEVNDDRITLFCDSMSKLGFKNDKQKILIFVGSGMFRGKEILIFDNPDTFGTYYSEDTYLFQRLKTCKRGVKIGLQLEEGRIQISLPQENIKTGLFEKE